jgi:hypothetical protein
MISFGVDLLAQRKQMLGTDIGTEAAALAGLTVDGQLGHDFRLLRK